MNLTLQKKLEMIRDMDTARQRLSAERKRRQDAIEAAKQFAADAVTEEEKATKVFFELITKLLGGGKVVTKPTKAIKNTKAPTKRAKANGNPEEYANRVAAVYSELAAATAPMTIRDLVGPKTGDFYQVRKALTALKRTKKARIVRVNNRAKWEVTK